MCVSKLREKIDNCNNKSLRGGTYMRIAVQLYDDNGCGCGMFYNDIETIEELLKFLDYISDNGLYSYEIREAKENE